MPNSLVRSAAEALGQTEGDLDRIWEECEAFADQEGALKGTSLYWSIVIKEFKKRTGYKPTR